MKICGRGIPKLVTLVDLAVNIGGLSLNEYKRAE